MNHFINYIKLYNYFREQKGYELEPSEALRNIWRTRNLPKEFKEIIYQILEGNVRTIAEFQVEGITVRHLNEEENMNRIQAVFFLDWLRREPGNARAYMYSRRYRDPFQVDDDKKAEIQAALDKWKQKTGKDIKSSLVPEDTTKLDIETETESEQMGVMTTDQLQERTTVQQVSPESTFEEITEKN